MTKRLRIDLRLRNFEDNPIQTVSCAKTNLSEISTWEWFDALNLLRRLELFTGRRAANEANSIRRASKLSNPGVGSVSFPLAKNILP